MIPMHQGDRWRNLREEGMTHIEILLLIGMILLAEEDKKIDLLEDQEKDQLRGLKGLLIEMIDIVEIFHPAEKIDQIHKIIQLEGID